jgi:hypothetical protein
MTIFEYLTPALYAFLRSSPFLIVWIIGIILSQSRRSRHPRMSKLMTAAFVIFIAQSMVGMGYEMWLLQAVRWSDGPIMWAPAVFTLFSIITNVIAWSLLLAAIFNRRVQPVSIG